MNAPYSPPSRNPADDGTMIGMLKLVLTKFLQNVDDMLPATVIAYDRTSNRASVQPLIAIVTTGNDQVTRAPIASLPVLQIGGGNALLSFHLNPGDLGWIKANDRDISIFKQVYTNSPPNTQRKHSFEDALFIPDIMRGYTINSEDEGNAVLQTKDGTQRVSIWPDRVKVTSSNLVIVQAPQITLDAATVEITGIISVLNVNSETVPCTINGQINATGDIIADTISLQNHIHPVTSAPGDTGAPIP